MVNKKGGDVGKSFLRIPLLSNVHPSTYIDGQFIYVSGVDKGKVHGIQWYKRLKATLRSSTNWSLDTDGTKKLNTPLLSEDDIKASLAKALGEIQGYTIQYNAKVEGSDLVAEISEQLLDLADYAKAIQSADVKSIDGTLLQKVYALLPVLSKVSELVERNQILEQTVTTYESVVQSLDDQDIEFYARLAESMSKYLVGMNEVYSMYSSLESEFEIFTEELSKFSQLKLAVETTELELDELKNDYTLNTMSFASQDSTDLRTAVEKYMLLSNQFLEQLELVSALISDYQANQRSLDEKITQVQRVAKNLNLLTEFDDSSADYQNQLDVVIKKFEQVAQSGCIEKAEYNQFLEQFKNRCHSHGFWRDKVSTIKSTIYGAQNLLKFTPNIDSWESYLGTLPKPKGLYNDESGSQATDNELLDESIGLDNHESELMMKRILLYLVANTNSHHFANGATFAAMVWVFGKLGVNTTSSILRSLVLQYEFLAEQDHAKGIADWWRTSALKKVMWYRFERGTPQSRDRLKIAKAVADDSVTVTFLEHQTGWTVTELQDLLQQRRDEYSDNLKEKKLAKV